MSFIGALECEGASWKTSLGDANSSCEFWGFVGWASLTNCIVLPANELQLVGGAHLGDDERAVHGGFRMRELAQAVQEHLVRRGLAATNTSPSPFR